MIFLTFIFCRGQYPALILYRVSVAKSLKGRTSRRAATTFRHALRYVPVWRHFYSCLISGTFIISKATRLHFWINISACCATILYHWPDGQPFRQARVCTWIALRFNPVVKEVHTEHQRRSHLDQSTVGAKWPGTNISKPGLETMCSAWAKIFVRSHWELKLQMRDFPTLFFKPFPVFLSMKCCCSLLSMILLAERWRSGHKVPCCRFVFGTFHLTTWSSDRATGPSYSPAV